MGGICGIINRDKKVNTEQLQKMIQVLKHRGPDYPGTHIGDNSGLASAKLKVDRWDEGPEPICNEDESVWAILDGQICDSRNWKNFLITKGHQLANSSQTEILAHLYEEFHDELPCKLEGEFCFAIFDQPKNKLMLVRDRVGHKPLHYLVKPDGFCFGSEIKSLLQDNDYAKRINLKALDDFMTFGYLPCPETMFEDIHQLAPGHMLIYEQGNVRIKPYWEFRYDVQTIKSEDYYCAQLYQLMEQAIRRRLTEGASFGAFLSGGLDSSTVVALMTSITGQPVKTFSVGFQEQSYDELPWAKIVAEHFSTEHYELVVQPEMVPTILPQIIWHYEAPLRDASAIPSWFAGKLARQHVKIVITADGPDQLLGGSTHHKRWNRNNDLPFRLTELLRVILLQPVMLRIHLSNNSSSFLEKIKRRMSVEALPFERRFVAHWTLGEQVKHALYSQDMLILHEKNDPFTMVEPYFARTKNRHLLERVLYFDICSFVPDDLMVKVDRMTMANSLETRSPFQDSDFMNFIATIPIHLKLTPGKQPISKYILKQSVSHLLPEATLNKKKQGFAPPIDKWLKKDLKEFVKAIILDPRAIRRGYFNGKFLENLIERYTEEKTDYVTGDWGLIFMLLTFEMWHRLFMDRKSQI